MIGKRPKEKGWHARGREDAQTALAWAKDGNIGIRTGAHSGGLVVLDDDSTEQTAARDLQLPQTVTVITGTGKRHFYFRCAQPLRNSVGKLAPGVDVRADGGVIVAAGSVHPDTRQLYRYAEGCSPKDVGIAELPEAIVAALVKPARSCVASRPIRNPRAYARKALENAEAGVRQAQNGARNNTLYRAAAGMLPLIATGAIAGEDVVDRLTAATDLPPAEIEATLRSALQEELPPIVVSKPRHAMLTNFTEVGLAEYIAAKLQDRIRFCAAENKFLVWDGQRWKVDDGSVEVDRLVIAEIKALRAASRTSESSGEPGSPGSFLKRNESERRVAAIRKLLPRVRMLGVNVSEFDADNWLLNTLNGLVDLRTGKLLPHDPSKLMTKLAPVEYNPDAKCTRFERFLNEIFEGDAEVITFVHRWFGYCLTGGTSEQRLPIFWGDGANGKTTLLEAVRGSLGPDYVTDAPESLIAQSARTEHPTELASIRGARLVIASETESSKPLRSALLKRLTGDQVIKSRRMFDNYSDVAATAKLVLVTNQRPSIDDRSGGMWRRLILLPFPVIIPESKRDPHLLDKLNGEREGILAWLVRGCLGWQAKGLHIPSSMATETETYRQTSDPVRGFVLSCCEQDPRAFTTSDEMHKAFIAAVPSCMTHDFFVKEFNRVIAQIGWNVTSSRSRNKRGWTGVTLRPFPPKEAPTPTR